MNVCPLQCRWQQSSRMSWCASWGASSGSCPSCGRTRWSCCRDSQITSMPSRAPSWATWRGWSTPSRSRSVSLFAGVGWKADQRMRRAQKGQGCWELRAVGAVPLHGCSITISVPLRARNSEIEQKRTDTFSVPLNLSYPLNHKCCSAGVDQRCTRYIIPPQAVASCTRVIMGWSFPSFLSSLRQVSTCTRNSIWLPYCITGYRISLFVHIYSYGSLHVPYVLSEKYFLLVLSNLVSKYLYCIMSHWFLCTFAALNLVMFPKLNSSSLSHVWNHS